MWHKIHHTIDLLQHEILFTCITIEHDWAKLHQPDCNWKESYSSGDLTKKLQPMGTMHFQWTVNKNRKLASAICHLPNFPGTVMVHCVVSITLQHHENSSGKLSQEWVAIINYVSDLPSRRKDTDIIPRLLLSYYFVRVWSNGAEFLPGRWVLGIISILELKFSFTGCNKRTTSKDFYYVPLEIWGAATSLHSLLSL